MAFSKKFPNKISINISYREMTCVKLTVSGAWLVVMFLRQFVTAYSSLNVQDNQVCCVMFLRQFVTAYSSLNVQDNQVCCVMRINLAIKGTNRALYGEEPAQIISSEIYTRLVLRKSCRIGESMVAHAYQRSRK